MVFCIYCATIISEGKEGPEDPETKERSYVYFCPTCEVKFSTHHPPPPAPQPPKVPYTIDLVKKGGLRSNEFWVNQNTGEFIGAEDMAEVDEALKTYIPKGSDGTTMRGIKVSWPNGAPALEVLVTVPGTRLTYSKTTIHLPAHVCIEL